MANQDVSRNDDKKRARDELVGSDLGPPGSKLARVGSFESDREHAYSDESAFAEPDPDEFEINSPEARRIQDDLLNELDSSGVPSIQDLDSVIRSFEEEILVPAPASLGEASGDARLELGYLLEASDDELGLPPSFSSGDDRKAEVIDLEADGPASNPLTQFVSIDDQMPCYEDSFELGIGCFDSGSNQGNDGYNCNGNDFLPLGCLFEHTEAGFEPSDVSDISWRPESLSAM